MENERQDINSSYGFTATGNIGLSEIYAKDTSSVKPVTLMESGLIITRKSWNE